MRRAVVTSVSPVEVRFWGDSVDTPIGWQSDALTLATNDIVLLAFDGGVWNVVCVLVAT